MKTIRVGVIGVGGIGGDHAQCLLSGKITGAELTAVARVKPELASRFHGARAFESGEDLIRLGAVDAVIIATPHYLHTPLGISALEAGLHVLMEKPIAVHVAEARRLIAARRNSSQVFAAMFNQRTDIAFKKLRQMIQDNELGTVRRIHWTVTNWFRSQAYFSSGKWRATWAGEGGGVLLNQAPHNLDLWWWLFGLPSRVRAFCGFGKYHDIEVEDEVTAFLEYANGTTGTFITSTGEAPGTNRLEVAAEMGKVVLENGQFHFTRNAVAMSEFSRTTQERFAAPPTEEIAIPVSGKGGQHVEIIQNFIDAIHQQAPLIAPAEEGIYSVELANAMIFSSVNERTINLRLDAGAYEAWLKSKTG